MKATQMYAVLQELIEEEDRNSGQENVPPSTNS